MATDAELNAMYERNKLELFALLQAQVNGANGFTGVDLLTVKRNQLAELLELLRKQKRELDYHAGEKIEPETHSVSAVLLATMGGGAG